MIDFEQTRNRFMSEYMLSDIPDTSKRQFKAWWKRIGGAETEIGKRIEEGYTSDDWIELLLKCSVRSVPTLTAARVYINKYLRYLASTNTEIEDSIVALASIKFEQLSFDKNLNDKILYYRNIAELRDAVENTLLLSKHKMPEKDPDSYLPHMAAVYLMWYGLSDEQIVSLKKSNVSRQGVDVDGKLLVVPEFVSDTLVRYRDSDGYTQQARGLITIHYLPSDYLFRTCRKDRLNKTNIAWFLTDFNKIAEKKYSLMPDVVRKSGNFYRYYMAECESVVNPILSNRAEAENFFGTEFASDKDWQNFVREYSMFKKLYK